MKIAVTGSAGTIGTRLCVDLARDHEVVRIDLHDADVVADVRDAGALSRAFSGCETVVHLAGVVAVEASWEDVYAVNIGGTYAAFEAARQAGVKRVIFASSNHAVGMHEIENVPAIYQPGAGFVVRTDTPFRPDSLYGVWKAFGEVLGRYYSDTYGMQVTCVRIGSITTADDPRDPSVRRSSGWLPLDDEQKFARYAATWMSQRDFARLVRAILARDVPFAVGYGVGDTPPRCGEREPGRAICGFGPLDGTAHARGPG
ncbi:MAG: NAD-dependent glucose-6-phosphate dehydrogenase Azf [Candidatus Elarobacter sp.]